MASRDLLVGFCISDAFRMIELGDSNQRFAFPLGRELPYKAPFFHLSGETSKVGARLDQAERHTTRTIKAEIMVIG